MIGDAKSMFIEVKGAGAGATAVQMTAPQVELARATRNAFVLVVVHTDGGYVCA